jgi:hypothetical protein
MKFQKVITVCKDLDLKANLEKCMIIKISWKTRSMEEKNYNNHKTKEM